MKKVAIFVLFIFSLICLGGLMPCLDFVSADVETIVQIKYATTDEMDASQTEGFVGLKQYIDGYSSANSNDKIVLCADIDMTGIVLKKTIGDATNPFKGSFDGKGYSIKNLVIDVSVAGAEEKTNQFAGLFGVVSGANIQNVKIDGKECIKVGGCLTANVGALVGKATNNSKFKNIQISAKVYLGTDFLNSSNETDFSNLNLIKTDFDFNVNFGGMAGVVQDSKISCVIVRVDDLGTLTFSRNDGKIHAIGGVAGRLNNSSVTFAVVQDCFSVRANNTFVGSVYLGGVVGDIVSGGSKIVDVAIENAYNIVDNTIGSVKSGEVAGLISNPVPIAENISYIHFKQNDLSAFGEAGGYENDTITESSYSLSNLAMAGGEWDYFSKENWHPLLGAWDFDKVWYVNAQNIYLQSFYGKFVVSVDDLNAKVLKFAGFEGVEEVEGSAKIQDEHSFDYDAEVVLKFDFAENMSGFYRATNLNLGSSPVATIITKNNAGKTTYSLSGSDAYGIEVTEKGFKVIIKNVNLSTAGNYSISTNTKSFTGKVSAKLFDEKGVEEENVSPAYVYYADAPYTTTESLEWKDRVVYGQEYRIDTKAKSGVPYAFDGWFKVLDNGKIERLGDEKDFTSLLTFTFGKDFVSDFEIYAKYVKNACNITFKKDEGILKMVVSEKDNIESEEQVVSVSKTDQAVKLEVFVDKNYVFNVKEFIKELDVYKSQDPNITFCKLRETRDEGDFVVYHFMLDMTTLQGDYSDSFTINAKTSQTTTENNTWMWWVIGAVGGAVVLALIILLIVFIVKHHGGGYGGGMKMKKANFKKNSYF